MYFANAFVSSNVTALYNDARMPPTDLKCTKKLINFELHVQFRLYSC